MAVKNSILAAFVAAALAMPGAASGQGSDGFVAGVTDVPLMPGLREIPEATLVYDKPDGRLVRTAARGQGRPAELWKFYEETLPQLGWRRLGRGHFVRDGESLRISVEKIGSELIVRFAIAPGSE
ncbi:MAG: hypothetical protein VCD66_09020 [Alphaproteobacteria bacterium]